MNSLTKRLLSKESEKLNARKRSWGFIRAHYAYFLLIDDVEITFGAAPTGNMQCQASPQCMQQELCGWSGNSITSRVATTFEVKIGPSGGLRGYEHITGEIFDIGILTVYNHC